MTMNKLQKLALYFYNEEQINDIQFDQYGRPYIQYNGRWMLTRKTQYNYTINN